MARALIVNADDFGMAPGVSRSILQLLSMGRISSTSAMSLTPEWQEEGAMLKEVEARRVGLHVTLTDFAPISSMPRLSPGGKLPSFNALCRLAVRGRLPLDEIRAEMERQFAAFADITGFMPAHADGHQHVHQLPGIRDVFLEMCARFQTPYIRVSAMPFRQYIASPKALGITLASLGLRKRAKRMGVACNQSFSGVYGFNPQHGGYGHYFERFLQGLGNGGLIMCHPGFVDAILKARDPVTDSREEEHAFFAGKHYPELLRRHGWSLKI